MTVVGGTAEPRVLLLTEAAILSDSAICRERLWALRRRFAGTRDLFSAPEVRRMEFVKQARAADPSLSLQQLARAVQQEFDLTVHPRSIERQLRRQKKLQ